MEIKKTQARVASDNAAIARRYEDPETALLRRREEELRARIKRLPVAVIVWDMDFRAQEWNPTAERIFGFSAKEALSKNAYDLIMPKELEPVLAPVWRKLLEDDQTAYSVNENLTKDGRTILCEWTNTTLRNPDGSVAGILSIAQDITERRKAEAVASQLAAIVQSSPDAITSKDLTGAATSWNRAAERLFGYSAAEMIGRPLNVLAPPDYKDDIAELTEKVLLDQQISDYETVRIRKDGTPVEVSIAMFPIKNDAGVVIGVSSIIRDISERKRLEDQLRQSQKMEAIGQLTGGIAHDFNNMLSVVIGNLDRLLEDFDDGSPHAKSLNQALKGALHGAELTHRLLAFARKQPLEPKPLAINDVLADVVSILNRTVGGAISVQVVANGTPWPVYVDPAQVQDALVNLAINARDAMPSGGVLTIETANVHLDEHYAGLNADVRAGDYAMLAVTDTGTGMSAEVAARAFEPFYTTKPRGEGTGLGLSMIYGFARQSGGHLKIYSELGHGTSVKLYLPRADEPAAAVQPAFAEPRDLPRGTETVLIAEDNEDLRQVTVEHLTSLGYHAIEAENGDAAMIVLRGAVPIDLLFTDVVMPGRMTGHELARQARKQRPGIKVLITTGYAGTASLVVGGEAKILRKPYRRQDMAIKIRELLDER